jgi:hypothetical protein
MNGQRDRNARSQGRFQRTLEPLAVIFFEYHAEAGVVDFRYPTVRLRKCADFFLTRYTRCAFYLFGRPTRFKLTLENHAIFPLLNALSNEFGERVLRVRRVGSFLSHVLGGGDDPGLYFSQDHTGITRGSSAKKCRNGDDGNQVDPNKAAPVLGTQTATTVIATSVQHQTIVFVSSFLPRK